LGCDFLGALTGAFIGALTGAFPKKSAFLLFLGKNSLKITNSVNF
jgi:hypothetical protein